MNVDIFVPIVCIISLIIGAFLGVLCFNIYNNRINKKLLKNAKEVLEGKRDNKIKIDGQEYDATKFITRDNDGNKVLTDLKGGGITKYGKEKEIGEKEIIRREPGNNQDTRKNSCSNGEKKRFTRARSVISRIRRFG